MDDIKGILGVLFICGLFELPAVFLIFYLNKRTYTRENSSSLSIIIGFIIQGVWTAIVYIFMWSYALTGPDKEYFDLGIIIFGFFLCPPIFGFFGIALSRVAWNFYRKHGNRLEKKELLSPPPSEETTAPND